MQLVTCVLPRSMLPFKKEVMNYSCSAKAQSTGTNEINFNGAKLPQPSLSCLHARPASLALLEECRCELYHLLEEDLAMFVGSRRHLSLVPRQGHFRSWYTAASSGKSHVPVLFLRSSTRWKYYDELAEFLGVDPALFPESIRVPHTSKATVISEEDRQALERLYGPLKDLQATLGDFKKFATYANGGRPTTMRGGAMQVEGEPRGVRRRALLSAEQGATGSDGGDGFADLLLHPLCMLAAGFVGFLAGRLRRRVQ
eukprot:m.99938 g.99938  ORF g.99938 m.99938 type:complete len:256 (-) comp15607_c1_seq4:275-1042(-)